MSTDRRLQILVNEEGQYSFFPDGRDAPPGWTQVCHGLSQAEAERYVEQHWTDITPRSARRVG